MKKLVVLLFSLCLIGCTRANYDEVAEKAKAEKEAQAAEKAQKETTTVCTGDNETITFYAKGDKILKEDRHLITDVSEELTENTDPDELMARVNEGLSNTYGELKGVSFSTYWEENCVHTILTIDYKEAKKDSLKEAGLLDSANDAEYVSLESTLMAYQKNSYACSVEK